MSDNKIIYADITIWFTDNNVVSLDVKNVRLDYLELTTECLKFRDLDDVWHVIPMDSLLYYTYKIRRD